MFLLNHRTIVSYEVISMGKDNQLRSGIFQGWVRHRRFTPVDHRFTYSMFMPHIHLNELEQLEKQVKGFGLSLFNFARFRRDDYVKGDPDLAQAVKDKVYALTGKMIDGNVTMLCHLRYCGLYFSPLNLYYLHDNEGQWQYMLAEVSNTPWNERHYYAIPAPQYWQGREYSHDKAFHVSPFNPIHQKYHWRVTEPDSNLLVNLAVSRYKDCISPSEYSNDIKKSHQKVFDATMQMRKQNFTSAILIKQLLLTPIMTIKVVIGIYWQALKLFIKGVPIYDHPNNTPYEKVNKHKIKRGNDNA